MKIFYLIVSIVMMLLFQACAAKPVEVKQTIIFPSYPEEPKILYLTTYRGGTEADTSSTLDVFLGEIGRAHV